MPSMNNVSSSTRKKWRAKLVNKQKDICAMCGNPMKGDATFDHIKPKALGGGTYLGNLQMVHRLCNERHGTRLNQKLMGINQEIQPRDLGQKS